jgi:hypothetical protein
MSNFAVVEVEKVWRLVVGFECRQVFRSEMHVGLFAGKDRKQKRQIGIVGVQQIQLAEVQRIVAGYRGEIGV